MHAPNKREACRARNGVVETEHGEVPTPGRATGLSPVQESCEKNGDKKYRGDEKEARWIGGETVVAFGKEREGD